MTVDTQPAARFSLPPDARAYRRIGPFDRTSLPKGLLHEHRLKAGTWGVLRILSGNIRFVWDDAGHEHEAALVGPAQSVIIPPGVSHHLEIPAGDVVVEIEFLEAEA